MSGQRRSLAGRRRRALAGSYSSHSAAALEKKEEGAAIGGAKAAELSRATDQDGATFVKAGAAARAHARGAPKANDAQKAARLKGAVAGIPADVFVSTPGGSKPEPITAAFYIVEADELVTSHDPRTFAVRPDYPAGVQERRYHVDRYEQLKVIRNAANMVPAFLVNNNPDSVNGPPVCALLEGKDLIVLGGNSRAMSLILAYDSGEAAAYRALLVERARVFGFEPRQLDPFQAPALVRICDAPPLRWRDLSRRLNEAQTQEKDVATDAVSLGARISDATLESFGAMVTDAGADETLTAVLTSPRARVFVDALRRDGVIDDRQGARYLSGRDLTEDGRTMVERALVARVLPSAETIERLSITERDGIARALPAILAARRAGHDLSADLAAAGADLADARARGLSLAELERQGSLIELTATRARSDVAVRLRALLDRGARRFVRVLRAFAAMAQAEPAQQGSFFGGRSTAELLAAADKATD